jgi:hypothetical protein
MRRRVQMGSDASVGKVSDGFGGGTKIRRTLGPAHGEDKREGNEGFFVGKAGKGDGEERCILGAQPEAVVSVTDVGFAHENGTVTRIGMKDFVEQAFECLAKLHG